MATAPSATKAEHIGRLIYVSNGATGSPVVAFSNGTNWLRVDTLAAIAAAWERCPRPAIMRRIVQTTQGHVTPNDFYRLPMGFESGPSWVGVDPAVSEDE